MMAPWLGQLELFPIEKPIPAAFQLQLPLTGGYWWGLLERPHVEKPWSKGARGNTTDTKITFRMRWMDGLTLENRVCYLGQAFTIRQIKEIGRRIGLDVVCEQVGP
jgi:hypothetical protein